MFTDGHKSYIIERGGASHRKEVVVTKPEEKWQPKAYGYSRLRSILLPHKGMYMYHDLHHG